MYNFVKKVNMKKALLFLGMLWFAHTGAFAQGIVFFEGTWEQALEKARAEEKPIFVDAYTTWCGPCKMMSQRIFPDPQVGDLFNANFISVKIDMEQEPGLKFQRQYPVRAYPTLLFIDGTGKEIKRVLGFQQVDAMLQIGRNVLAGLDKSSELAAAYAKGERDPALVYTYIRSLNRAGEPSLRIANDFLRGQSDLSTEANLKIIFEATLEADTRVFEWLTRYRKEMNNLYGEEKVNDRIYDACLRTARKALEMNTPDLREEVERKMGEFLPLRARAFASRMDMEQALRTKDTKAYLKAVQIFAKEGGAEPSHLLKSIAMEVAGQPGLNEQGTGYAARLLRMAAENTPRSATYLDLGEFLLSQGDKAGARSAAEKAAEWAKKEGPQAEKQVSDFMLKLG